MVVFLIGCAWSLTCALTLLVLHKFYNHKPEMVRYALGAGTLFAATLGWAWCVQATGQQIEATGLTLAMAGIAFAGYIAVAWAHDRDDQRQASEDRARGSEFPFADQEP